MSEKKAKQARQNADVIVAEYSIKIYGDSSVGVEGNLDNLPMFFDMMNRAGRIVLDRFVKKKAGVEEDIIIATPNLKLH